MARKPRLHVAGGVYHVMVRGNGGQEIFFDVADRSHLYLLMQEEKGTNPLLTMFALLAGQDLPGRPQQFLTGSTTGFLDAPEPTT